MNVNWATRYSLGRLFVVSYVFLALPAKSTHETFEALFQGQCGSKTPCQHLCFDLHDGTFECDCRPGYILDKNGYSCSVDNSTESYKPCNETRETKLEEIFYEKETSLVAKLELPYNNSSDNNDSTSLNQTFVGGNAYNESSTTSEAEATGLTHVCSLECGVGDCIRYVVDDEARERCRCPLGLGGDTCQSFIEITIPRFHGTSWMEFNTLEGAYKDLQLVLEFQPSEAGLNGLLLYASEKSNLEGDFIAILIRNGFIEFRFDCGSGMGLIESHEAVLLNRQNRLTVYRHRWDVWLQLNNGKHSQGRSQGLFSHITFREPLSVGGARKMSLVSSRLNISTGFDGCLQHLEINHHVYDFRNQPIGNAHFGFDVDECSQEMCSHVKCQHGGKCMASYVESPCLCPLGYMGDLCQTPIDLLVPSFNGSSFLKYPGLGTSSLMTLDLTMSVKPASRNGILVYNSQLGGGGGDYIVVLLRDGHLEFRFSLGDDEAVLSSQHPLTIGEWSTLVIHRTGKMGYIKITNQNAVSGYTDGAFTQMTLSDSLFLGGIPPKMDLPESLQMNQSFHGCIQKVEVNKRPIQVLAEALSGLNVENCDHPCITEPCSNGGYCIPKSDGYSCDCPVGYTAKGCTQPIAGEIKVPMFFGNSYLYYNKNSIVKKLEGNKTSVSFLFRTRSSRGLLFWTGQNKMFASSDFFAIGIQEGLLHVRYNLGSGDAFVVYNSTSVDDGSWHHVKVERLEQDVNLTVDTGPVIMGKSPGKMKILNTDQGLYIGGLQEISYLSLGRYQGGLTGCIADIFLSPSLKLDLVPDALRGSNIYTCE